MGYLLKIAAGSKKADSRDFYTNRLATAVFGLKLGKISRPYNHDSETGSFSRLKTDEGTRAVFTNEAIGTSIVSRELESGVSVNVIHVQDSIEQIRTPTT